MYQLNETQREWLEDNKVSFQKNNWKAIINNYYVYTDEDEDGTETPLKGIGGFFYDVFGEDFLKNLSYIPYSFFYGCNNIKDLVIPENITHTGGYEYPFLYCPGLVNLKLPANKGFTDCYNKAPSFLKGSGYKACFPNLRKLTIQNPDMDIEQLLGDIYNDMPNIKIIECPNNTEMYEELCDKIGDALPGVKVVGI